MGGAVVLRPYQQDAVNAVREQWANGNMRTLLVMSTGCHEPTQGILMADGNIKQAQGVGIGDLLMGPDGAPRTVIALHAGSDEMFRVTPIKGDSFVVNSQHLLQLVHTNRGGIRNKHDGKVSTIKACEWNNQNKSFRHVHKLYRATAINKFFGNDGLNTTIDPYFIGVLLGDGQTSWGAINVTTPDEEIIKEVYYQANKYNMTITTKPAGKAKVYYLHSGHIGCKGGRLHNELKSLGMIDKTAGNKAVPFYYKTLPLEKRLDVLAGLLDTDGSLTTGGYDFISKSRQLSEDVAFMARSSGLAAYVKECQKSCGDFTGIYWRVSISGDCSIIPCRISRKKAPSRKQKKDVLRTGFNVESVGVGEYHGFTVDGDNLYLLDDFTVTHNCGKTTVFGEVARRCMEKGNRTLVLAHRGELIDQAARRLSDMCQVSASIEKAESHYDGKSPLCVASVQTLQGNRLERFPMGDFAAMIIDEAHHSIADSYRRIIDAHGGYLLGVTATADRADKRGLAEVYDSIAYEYPLARAVADGYLSPIKAKCLPLAIDISNVKITHGDYQADELGSALDPYLPEIARTMREECAGRKTVVFLPLVSTAEKMADELNAVGLKAISVSGYDKDRAERLNAFERGEYDVLTNALLLTEGYDCPSIDCVVMLRPTKSRGMYCQAVGRGTRLNPGKKDLLLLDFLWMTDKHDLCRPASLLGREPEVTKKMEDMLEEKGIDPDAIDLLELAEQCDRDVAAEREAKLAEELERMKRRKKKYVDPLQFAMSIQDLDLIDYRPTFAFELKPPSDAQKKSLDKFGIDSAEVTTAGLASKLLDALHRRVDNHLATPKQVRCLERFGFQHVGTWSFDAANSMIARLSACGWKKWKLGIDPATYDPRSAA